MKDSAMLDLVLAQLAVLLMYAGGNERIIEFITKQVEARLKYKLSGGSVQFISAVTGVIICFTANVALIPKDVIVQFGFELNHYANITFAGAVVGLGSGVLHDLIGFITGLKGYFKGTNTQNANMLKATERTGKI